MNETGTVLVTGGAGFLAGWCTVALLEQGYSVRATLRNPERQNVVRAALNKRIGPGDRLSFHTADLTRDEGWDRAADGCDYVLHVASPLGVREPKNPDDLIIPARDGSLRVLRAAIKAGVKRVVLTSSVGASTRAFSAKSDSLDDETHWTELNNPKVTAYVRSKTIAERAAWDLMATAGGAATLATVNPTLIVGPVLSPDFSESVKVVERLLFGKMPGIPRLGFNFVDVRDVADLHIRAMTSPKAAGERFIAAGHFALLADVADILRTQLGPQAAKVPTRTLPDLALRVAALFDSELKSVLPRLGHRHDATSAKAQARLGWRPRPLEDTVLDCAKSLIALESA